MSFIFKKINFFNLFRLNNFLFMKTTPKVFSITFKATNFEEMKTLDSKSKD